MVVAKDGSQENMLNRKMSLNSEGKGKNIYMWFSLGLKTLEEVLNPRKLRYGQDKLDFWNNSKDRGKKITFNDKQHGRG